MVLVVMMIIVASVAMSMTIVAVITIWLFHLIICLFRIFKTGFYVVKVIMRMMMNSIVRMSVSGNETRTTNNQNQESGVTL